MISLVMINLIDRLESKELWALLELADNESERRIKSVVTMWTLSLKKTKSRKSKRESDE